MSSGVEWAVHCCVVLGQATAPVPAAQLATLHGVSSSYLAKVLQALSRAGIAHSTQGAVGGYALTADPSTISVLDVVLAVDGAEPAFRCTEIRQRGPLAAPPQACQRPCAVARAMAAAEAAWRSALAEVSIADLAADVETDTDGAAFPRLRAWLRGADAHQRPTRAVTRFPPDGARITSDLHRTRWVPQRAGGSAADQPRAEAAVPSRVGGSLDGGQHPLQGRGDRLRLGVGQVAGEVLLDPGQVARGGGAQPIPPGRGEHGEDRALVLRVAFAHHQAGPGQVVDHPAHPLPTEHHPRSQLAHPQPALRRRVQLQQHVVPGQRQLVCCGQLPLQRRDQCRMHAQQRRPGRDPVPSAASSVDTASCVAPGMRPG